MKQSYTLYGELCSRTHNLKPLLRLKSMSCISEGLCHSLLRYLTILASILPTQTEREKKKLPRVCVSFHFHTINSARETKKPLMMIIDNNDSRVGEYENLIILKLHWNVSWVFSNLNIFSLLVCSLLLRMNFVFQRFFIESGSIALRTDDSNIVGIYLAAMVIWTETIGCTYNATTLKMYWINYR